MAQLSDSTIAEEYVLDSPRLRQFIEQVDGISRPSAEPAAVIAAIRPHFAELLADKS
jgi:hypothetical protein